MCALTGELKANMSNVFAIIFHQVRSARKQNTGLVDNVMDFGQPLRWRSFAKRESLVRVHCCSYWLFASLRCVAGVRQKGHMCEQLQLGGSEVSAMVHSCRVRPVADLSTVEHSGSMLHADLHVQQLSPLADLLQPAMLCELHFYTRATQAVATRSAP